MEVFDMFLVPKELLNEILQNLGQQPYVNVFKLVNDIKANCKPMKRPQVVAKKEEGADNNIKQVAEGEELPTTAEGLRA
jgi:hypothetical protein